MGVLILASTAHLLLSFSNKALRYGPSSIGSSLSPPLE